MKMIMGACGGLDHIDPAMSSLEFVMVEERIVQDISGIFLTNLFLTCMM